MLSKCRKWRHRKETGTLRTWSSGSQQTFNDADNHNLPEKLLFRDTAPRIELWSPDKDVEAGLPHPHPPATICSDSVGLAPNLAGVLNIHKISHPYTLQPGNRSVEDFTHLINHINPTDHPRQRLLLNSFQNEQLCEKRQYHQPRSIKEDRPASLPLLALSSTESRALEEAQRIHDNLASTPSISHFSWNDESNPSPSLNLSKLGKSVASRLDSWISVPKEKHPSSVAYLAESSNNMADLPMPPVIAKHLTHLSDVSVYSYRDAQTTTLSRGNTVVVHSKPDPSMETPNNLQSEKAYQ